MASAAWLVARGLTPPPGRWHVEILLSTSRHPPDDDTPTVLCLELFSEEWGFWFRHDGKTSWIRITDLPFVHGRDDHNLLASAPALKSFGSLVRAIERRFDIGFVTKAAEIRSSLVDAGPVIRAWIADW
jgi:hypothetical protein